MQPWRPHADDVLKIRVIPCLDVKDGRVVKGVNFTALRDAGDPVEQARAYDEAGADELMFLDITASSDGRAAMYDVIARTAEACFMPLSVGGGVRTVEDARRLLRSGADKVSVNTAAVENPDLITACADAFGVQCVVAVNIDGGFNGGHVAGLIARRAGQARAGAAEKSTEVDESKGASHHGH